VLEYRRGLSYLGGGVRKILLVLYLMLATGPAWALGPTLYFYTDRERMKATTDCFFAEDNNGIRACSFLILVGGPAPKELLYHHRGSAYALKGQFDHAIAGFTQAITIRPKDALYYALRAQVRQITGDTVGASADAATALEKATNELERNRNSENYNARAWILHIAGKDDQALADVATALEVDSENSDILETRAEIYEKLGNRDGALADYRKALGSAQAHEESTNDKMISSQNYNLYLRAHAEQIAARAGLKRLSAVP
jgi:tetratricopeptide (TPR) repeat protein